MKQPLAPFLKKILCCPACQGALTFGKDIACTKCKKRYRIKDGIPHMLSDGKIISKKG